MNALLVYPESPDSFWGFKHAISFTPKKSNEPPLGLMTVAAMLPRHWSLRLIDLEVGKLKPADIDWAEMVFISAMSIQEASAREVIDRCRDADVPVVAGGPLFTSEWQRFPDVDHLVLNEAESTLPRFLKDLENGAPEHLYQEGAFPTMETTPPPRWDLINLDDYVTVNIQYSRGCPFDCDFCDITELFGHRVRTKSRDQFLTELDSLYDAGWREGVFIVDDNFIGNKGKLKRSVLPSLIRWQTDHDYPFTFGTEVSIDITDDEELLVLMSLSGFDSLFIGVESPNPDSLAECNKKQNLERDLTASIQRLYTYGFSVKAGFIVGFDNDPPSIFETMSTFIQESRIVTAMVGLLNAPRGTRLYQRLKGENRLLDEITGSNTDYSINFTPKMGKDKLVKGYRSIINSIYSQRTYYERVREFLRSYQPMLHRKRPLKLWHLQSFLKSILYLGIIYKGRRNFWKLLLWTSFRRPRMIPQAITLAIYGFHFRKSFQLS